MYLGHNSCLLRTGCSDYFVCFCFSLDKLKCLEEGEDPEVIPENTDLVTLGYGGLCFCYLFKYFFQHYIIRKLRVWYCYPTS